jgi:hypothetical protein
LSGPSEVETEVENLSSRGASVDEIADEHELRDVFRDRLDEASELIVTPVNVTDHPDLRD